MSSEVAERVVDHTFWREADVGGVGGTLAGNALSLAAVRRRSPMSHEDAFEHMIGLAERFEQGVAETIAAASCRGRSPVSGAGPSTCSPPRGRETAPRRRAALDEDSIRSCTSTCSTGGILLTPYSHDGSDVTGDHREQVDLHRKASRRQRPSSRWLTRRSPRSPGRRRAEPDPLDPDQVIAGDPQTSAAVLATTPAGGESGVWRCTPGTFRDVEADEPSSSWRAARRSSEAGRSRWDPATSAPRRRHRDGLDRPRNDPSGFSY